MASYQFFWLRISEDPDLFLGILVVEFARFESWDLYDTRTIDAEAIEPEIWNPRVKNELKSSSTFKISTLDNLDKNYLTLFKISASEASTKYCKISQMIRVSKQTADLNNNIT